MRLLIVAVLIGIILVSTEALSVEGYSLFYSQDNNGSLCKQQNPLQIKYYNGASAMESLQVPWAAEVWNDVPALLYFAPVSNQGMAAVVINSTNNPNFDFFGTTYNHGGLANKKIYCSNGYVNTPVVITLADANIQSFEQQYPNVDSREFVGQVIAHEMGHSLGLAHSGRPCTLMYEYDVVLDPQCQGGVFFPVKDDIDGAIALYGVVVSTPFSNTDVSGGYLCWYCNNQPSPPIYPPTLMVAYGCSCHRQAGVYNSGSLPSSGIALMFAHVTATTLNRFGVGWQIGAPASGKAFVNFELDNDGAKLVIYQGDAGYWGVDAIKCYTCSSFTPLPNVDYFVELVVESEVPVKAHAYLFDGAYGQSEFLGHTSDVGRAVVCGFGCHTITANWNDASWTDAMVWADGPATLNSNATLGGYWNFQGSMSKTNGGGGAGSLVHGTLITMADGTRVPVQNIRVGDKMLGYETTYGSYTISTVTRVTVVPATNMLVIHTDGGIPLRVDASTTENLWTKPSSGAALWLPVTQLRVGDSLLTQQGWRAVTRIEVILEGNHVMYDISATQPYFANGYLDPPIPS
ncbi:matrixin family metalloprotease [Candidatus Bathyarchaeota archaeon]|nr:MAG: matrixin family metalloprotease [Candidatus Bathyarchaeota archaeon]